MSSRSRMLPERTLGSLIAFLTGLAFVVLFLAGLLTAIVEGIIQ